MDGCFPGPRSIAAWSDWLQSRHERNWQLRKEAAEHSRTADVGPLMMARGMSDKDLDRAIRSGQVMPSPLDRRPQVRGAVSEVKFDEMLAAGTIE